MIWWIVGGVVVLGLVLTYSLARIAKDADERMAKMREEEG